MLFVVLAVFSLLLHSSSHANVIPIAFWKPTPPPVPRLISNSYFTDWNGATYRNSTGMDRSNFMINTTGVNNGDLMIIIGTIDNGSTTVWPNPIFPGWTQIVETYYGGDGETYVVAWKIANNESTTLSGVYGSGIISASTTLTLLAVSGANKTSPINITNITNGGSTNVTNVTGNSTGVTTTLQNTTLIYMQGVDWNGTPGTAVFTTPTGFTSLTQIGDHGNNGWDWTSQQVAYKYQPLAGASGSISGGKQVSSGFQGVGWTGVIAISP